MKMEKERKRALLFWTLAVCVLLTVWAVIFSQLHHEPEVLSETEDAVVHSEEMLGAFADKNLITYHNEMKAVISELEQQRVEEERLEQQRAEEERLELERQQAEAELTRELEDIVCEMSIEEKVGQMFFVPAKGNVPQEVFDIYHVGGIILFGEDFQGKTPETLIEYIQGFQDKSTYPLLIGSDEEGGTVTRVSKNSNLAAEAFQSPQTLYEKDGYEAIKEDAHSKSQLLLSYGINVNFAPVCDLSFDPDDFMYKRAFGTNVSETCQFVTLVVQIMGEEHIGSVLKHFPGYGDNGDTHKSIIIDNRDFSEFETKDFLPFSSGIDAGADCVMISHNIVTSMDTEYPASLSQNVHRILREDLGFTGVIITDDMGMAAVTEFVGIEDAAILAVQAGNDMLLTSNYRIQYQAVLDAVKEGIISEEQIDESVLRILRWKYDLGLLEDLNI